MNWSEANGQEDKMNDEQMMKEMAADLPDLLENRADPR